MGMLRTAEIDMADTVSASDIADFLTNAAWAICSTYHMVLKASSGAAIFGRDMLFGIPFIKRQLQTDHNTRCENKTCVDWDHKVGNKVLVHKDGILHKSERRCDSDPWTITSVHTNGTINDVGQNQNV